MSFVEDEQCSMACTTRVVGSWWWNYLSMCARSLCTPLMQIIQLLQFSFINGKLCYFVTGAAAHVRVLIEVYSIDNIYHFCVQTVFDRIKLVLQMFLSFCVFFCGGVCKGNLMALLNFGCLLICYSFGETLSLERVAHSPNSSIEWESESIIKYPRLVMVDHHHDLFSFRSNKLRRI